MSRSPFQHPLAPFSRRLFAGGAAITAAALGSTTLAQEASPSVASPVADHGHDEHEHEHGDLVFLAVADPVAETVAVYSLPDHVLIDTLTGVVANAHAGFLPVASGELLFIDDAARQLVSVEVHGDHIDTHTVDLPGTAFSHLAVDSDHAHWAAVGTDDPAASIVLVDLETWETILVALPEAGEVGLMLSHDLLFHRNDVSNQVEAYWLSDLVEGVVEPVSTVPIGPFGHGESITMDGDTLYIATDEGIEAVAWDGEALTFLTAYPWATAEREGGRGYFPRLSFDDRQVVSYTADRSGPETEWETWENDALLIDTRSGEVNRFELGPGYVYRFGLAEQLALFTRIGGDGDEAIVVDLATGAISMRIPLEPMTTGPVSGSSIWEANQYRAVAVLPDGTTGYVTQGGDGLVRVLDLETGEVVDTITTETSLDGGGYLAVFGTPETASDLIAR
jgi:hypothetical protein